MRIDRLAITGFGPFAARQEIDFRELDEAGLFLITGRTGSGKSSILDAICFALYGTAPRYDGTQARLRSDHAGPDVPTEVRLEFTVAGERWRVTRSPEWERPKKRGDGFTRTPATAALERADGDGWQGVASRPVDVAEHLAPVLQLTREQFLQVILLAQGRFQEFLRAKNDERIALLRALFGTERFQRFEEEVAARAKALEQSVGASSAVIAGDAGRLAELAGVDPAAVPDGAWAAGAAQDLASAATAAEAEEARAADLFTLADRAEAAAVALAGLQRRAATAREAVARLTAQQPEVDAARRRAAEAVRVLPVLPAVAQAERAGDALSAAERAVGAAAQAAGGDVDDPGEAAALLDEHLGALREPLALEVRLPALDGAASAAGRASASAGPALADAEAAVAALPARRDELQSRRADSIALAAGLPDADAAVERARAAAAAARRVDRLTAALADDEAAVAASFAREQAALERFRAITAARFAGAAGLLAAALEPGAPCPVCGAVEHPSPAAADTGDVPDDATAAAAEVALGDASRLRAEATDRAAATRSAAAVAVQASGGLDVPAADALEQAATGRRAAAAEAASAAAGLDRDLAALDAEQLRLAAAVDAARAVVAERAADVERTAAAARAARAAVTGARGDAPSVAVLISALTTRRDLLRALDRARSARAEAGRALEEASSRLQEALDQARLPDAAAARALALGEPERRALEQRVDDHAGARAAAAAQLADPAVAGASADPADVGTASLAKADALAARVAAADRRADAAARAVRGSALAASIAAAEAAAGDDRQQLAVLAPLAAVVHGDGANERRMRLESYVLAARLEQIVAAANGRLAVMTDGRFTLQHDDSVGYRNTRSGLGLQVLDEHTGRPRPIASLSGGETFLASLALALGLAEVVSAEAGGVRLDTLFVDEGFGSLDRQTLDTAMETLDGLRAGGRVVGLISHVEAMQEAIPAGLHVDRTANGPSTVTTRLAVPA